MKVKKIFISILFSLVCVSSLYSAKIFSPFGTEFLRSKSHVLFEFNNLSPRSNMEASFDLNNWWFDRYLTDYLICFYDKTPLFDANIYIVDVPVAFSPLILERSIRSMYYPNILKPDPYYGIHINTIFQTWDFDAYYSLNPEPEFHFSTNNITQNNYIAALKSTFHMEDFDIGFIYQNHLHRDVYFNSGNNIFKPSRNQYKDFYLYFKSSGPLYLKELSLKSDTGEQKLNVNDIILAIDWPRSFTDYSIEKDHIIFNKDVVLKLPGDVEQIKVVYAGDTVLSGQFHEDISYDRDNFQEIPYSQNHMKVKMDGLSDALKRKVISTYTKEIVIYPKHFQNEYTGLSLRHKTKHVVSEMNFSLLQKNRQGMDKLYSYAVNANSDIRFDLVHTRVEFQYLDIHYNPYLGADSPILPNASIKGNYYFSTTDDFDHLNSYGDISDAFFNFYLNPKEFYRNIGDDINNNAIFDERELRNTPKNMNSVNGSLSGFLQVEFPLNKYLYAYNSMYYEEIPNQRTGLYQPMLDFSLNTIPNFRFQTVLGNRYFFIKDQVIDNTITEMDYEVLKEINNHTMIYINASYSFPFVDWINEFKGNYSYSKDNISHYDIIPIVTFQKTVKLGKYLYITPRYKSLWMWIDNNLGGMTNNNSLVMRGFEKFENYNIFILETTIQYFMFKWMNGYEITDYHFTHDPLYILEDKNSYLRDSFLSRLEYRGKYLGRHQGLSITYSYTQIREKARKMGVFSSLFVDLTLGF